MINQIQCTTYPYLSIITYDCQLPTNKCVDELSSKSVDELSSIVSMNCLQNRVDELSCRWIVSIPWNCSGTPKIKIKGVWQTSNYLLCMPRINWRDIQFSEKSCPNVFITHLWCNCVCACMATLCRSDWLLLEVHYSCTGVRWVTDHAAMIYDIQCRRKQNIPVNLERIHFPTIACWISAFANSFDKKSRQKKKKKKQLRRGKEIKQSIGRAYWILNWKSLTWKIVPSKIPWNTNLPVETIIVFHFN